MWGRRIISLASVWLTVHPRAGDRESPRSKSRPLVPFGKAPKKLLPSPTLLPHSGGDEAAFALGERVADVCFAMQDVNVGPSGPQGVADIRACNVDTEHSLR
jgi:hypothetical protein